MDTMVRTAGFILLAATLAAGCAHETNTRTGDNEQPGSRSPAASPATEPTSPPLSSPSTTPGSGSGTMDSGPGAGSSK
ncbi:MAG TPA: hypothetical protein VGL09_03340 [Methylomirabilota bacterium]|jgi:hypothetical protein